MVTVIKKDPQGQEMLRYEGEITSRLANGIIIQATWTLPAKDLGYTRFEVGDLFTEYYYTDHWFNIFAVESVAGVHKGWYCNIAVPATITDGYIEQIDLLLDVWITPQGKLQLLDEDEFAVATTLSQEQRDGAHRGLQELLQMIERRQEAFAHLAGA